jgi:phage terminase large subunit
MSEITITPTKRQSQAWKYLTDNKTNIVLFGGSAGGGKSWLGCLWITTLCLQYPGTRYLIGRTVLQQLKLTTLNTLFDLLSILNLKSGQHYNFNGQSNVITFYNGSEIILKDLAYQPSDPNFDSLGSLELTGAFIDEAAQINNLAYSIIKSRIRYKLNEFKLIPKVLMTCNPSNNWLKKDFYIPWKENKLDPNKQFIPSLPMDNPHLPSTYIEMLKELPPQQRKRLLEGDWNYLDESDSIFKFDDITLSLFRLIPNNQEKKYMTVDVARFGDDRSVLMIWVGLVVVECRVYRKLSTTELSREIQDLMRSYKIPNNQVIVDSDGVGGGVADQIRGVNFVNNAKPLHGENFQNLKTQCYIKLSESFKEGSISINITDQEMMDELTQELLVVKLKDLDKDTKISILSKDEVKRMLGKSPDLSDALMMRMYFELKNNKTTGRYAIAMI